MKKPTPKFLNFRAMLCVLAIWLAGASHSWAQNSSALIGWWNFSGQTLTNSGTTGSTNDGIYLVSGAASTAVFSSDTPFGMGHSLNLTASHSCMEVQNTASGDPEYTGSYDSQVPNFTVAMWEKRPSAAWLDDAWNCFVSKTDDNTAGFYVRRQGADTYDSQATVNPGYQGAYSPININDGQWHHLAMTLTNGQLSYYIDGNLAASTSTSGYVPYTAGELIFGAINAAGTRPDSALMNDLRFYNYALNASQVANLAAPQGLPVISGLSTNYTKSQGASFSFNTTVFSSPAATIQWFYNGSMIQNATNASLAFTNVQVAQGGNYSIVASNSYGSITNSTLLNVVVPAPALMGWWNFSGQTLANSGTTGSTNDGIYLVSGASGTAAFSSDTPFGTGYSLDLTASHSVMEVQNTASGDSQYTGGYDSQAPNFTVAMWEKRPSATWLDDAWNCFVSKTDDSSGGFYVRREGADANDSQAAVNPGYQSAYSSVNINDGRWHHLAVTLNNGKLSYYVDGNLAASTATSGYVPYTAGELIFGAGNASGFRPDSARMNDLRFYNYALNASEVANLVIAPGLPKVSLVSTNYHVYQGVSPSLNATVIANPSATLQWFYNGSMIQNATNAALVLTNIQIAQSGTYFVVASNSYGSATNAGVIDVINDPSPGLNPNLILANNPIGYWRFNDGESTTAYDTAGGNNAYDPLASALQPGPLPPTFPGFESTNTAPFMDGKTQGYATTVPLLNNHSTFTIMGWFNIDGSQYPIATDPFNHPEGRASLFGQSQVAELGFYGGTNIYFYGPGINQTIFVTSGFTTNQWEFIAAVSDAAANTSTVYLNGVAVGTASACSGSSSGNLFSIGKNVAYPTSLESGYDTAFFPGGIDEVAVFNKALSASTIQSIYNSAAGVVSLTAPTNVMAHVESIGGVNSFVLTASGGTGSSYTVLSTTNLTSGWVTNVTNVPFGPGGSVSFTNAINGSNPREFYRIRVP